MRSFHTVAIQGTLPVVRIYWWHSLLRWRL